MKRRRGFQQVAKKKANEIKKKGAKIAAGAMTLNGNVRQ